MTSPPPAGPDFDAPGFVGCYRHPDRATGIRCQRCRKPICGECMNAASVGFQCPRCVGLGRAGVRAPRTRFGAGVGSTSGTVTKVLMGVLGAVWVLDFAAGLGSLLYLNNSLVQDGQVWRLLTYALTTGGLLGLAMNLLVLWLAGRAIESELGGVRFLVLYLACGLGGATAFFLLGPAGGTAIGASTAVVGLLAANAIGKAKTGEDIRGDVSLLVLLVLYAVLVGFSGFGWLGLLGGIAVGAVTGALLAYAPRANRVLVQTVGLLATVAACVAAVAAKIVL